MKKMLSLILCALMLLTLVPVTAVTAHADTGSINVISIEYDGTQPVQLMEGFDMSVYTRRGENETGDEINIEYDQYALSKLDYKVTYEDWADGGKVKTETLWGYEIARLMQGWGLLTSGDHKNNTPWKAGEKYTATVYAGAAECEVQIEIVENPYESLRYLGSGAIPIVADEDGVTDGDGNWYYNLHETRACFEAKLKDGRTVQGTLDQIEKAAGNAEIVTYYTRDSSEWGVGKTYPVWFGCNGVGWSGYIYISDKSSFTGLTCEASESREPVRLSPNDCYWDGDGNLCYTLMFLEDLEFTVTLSAAGKEKYGLEGNTFTGTWDQIIDRFGVSLSEENNLGENWEIDGTTVYYITMRIGDGHCKVPVVIDGSAKVFEYIKLEDPNEVLELIEGIDASWISDGAFFYNVLGMCNPTVTVKLTDEAKRYYEIDDDTLTMPWREIRYQFNRVYADDTTPDFGDWELRDDGVYVCPVKIYNGMDGVRNGIDDELTLDVPVKLIPETQIKSVQLSGSAVELVANMDSFTSYNEYGNEIAIYYLTYAIEEGRAKFRVTLNDGATIEGTSAEIYEKLGYSGRLPLDDYAFNKQFNNPWNVGETGHSITVYFGKKSCTVPVTLSDPWVSNIELANCTYLTNIYDAYSELFGEDVQLKLTLTAAGKAKFGKSTITGTVEELREAMGGIGFEYNVEDDYSYKVGEEYEVTVRMGGCKTTLPVKIVEGTKVALTAANFPDANFRAYLEENYDWDGYVIIEAVDYITCCGRNISSLKGIENFKKLRSLDCSDNRLTKLDVSKNTKLEALYCGGNSLTELDVSRNTALQLLACDRNQLTELNVSKNTALVELNCSQNKLSALDTTKCANLEVLYCANNQSTKKLTVNVAKLDGLNLSTTGAQGNVEIKVNGAAPSGKPVTGTLDAGGMRLTLSQNGKVKYMTIIVGDQYRFDAVVNGKYTLTAEDYNYDDYVPRSTTVTVTNGTITGMDGFKLARSGDVNLDGTLDVYDLQLLYEYVSKIAEVKDDYVKAVADMNGKNGVEITDVQRLYAILTGTGINSAMTG